jgi:hypothetical protein
VIQRTLEGGVAKRVLVTFSHAYPKLENDIFPTIRSPAYNKNRGFDIGDVGICEVQGKPTCTVKLVDYIDARIQDIPLFFLQYDAGHPDVFQIYMMEDFVLALNELTKKTCGFPGNNKLTTKKRIYFFEKIRKEEYKQKTFFKKSSKSEK